MGSGMSPRICLLFLWVVLGACHPTLWTGNHLDKVSSVQAGLKCTSHPEAAYSHPAPVVNSGVTFTLSNGHGGAVTAICPAVAYQLLVQLPSSGHVFITASAGSMTPGIKCADGSGTRYAMGSDPNPPSSYTQALTMSCADLVGKTDVAVRVTFANGPPPVGFQTNSITFQIDPTCMNTTCGANPPPVPSPSPAPPTNNPPPPPTGSPPSPAPRPVYPSCIGATPLPDNPPLGKACFYDKECKVQCEDLRYPNCGNAAPLPCPFPKGKCCFYDSQCKPQCEDLGNSACPKLPPCSVNGCSQCSATAADTCLACNSGAGYMLNLATMKCDCMPGYYGTTTCAKCPAGKISYGKKTVCMSCPAGTVANPAQSECVVDKSWSSWGMDLTNRRWAYNEKLVNVSTAPGLKMRWNFTAGADISATPTIVVGRLYVPDWSGNLHCLNASTGAVIWQKAIWDYVTSFDSNTYPPISSPTNIISRTSPAMADGKLVVGVMKKGGGFPYLLAINPSDGTLMWGKRVDPHAAAMVTQSPTIYNGHIYVGVSSLEELHASDPAYDCCSFIGSMLKVNLNTGDIVWRTLMAPDNGGKSGGFSGNSVWGSSPSIDVARSQVYIATGNNYEIPDALSECLKPFTPLTVDNMQSALNCEKAYPTNYHNSMLALSLDDGSVKWAKQLGGPDAWNGACMYGAGAKNCPDLNSPDYDFAQAPMLVTACKSCRCKQLVVAGQKSGWVWALVPETGAVHWALPVGPGGTVGGIQWGSAADTSRIYVSNNNYNMVKIDLTAMKAVPNVMGSTTIPTSTEGGIAGAVDSYDGTLVWTFANPTLHWGDDPSRPGGRRNARSQAPMTVAGNVTFYSSMDLDGTIFFLNAATGKLLGSFKSGMTSGCGASVVDGRVYVGSGYSNFGLGLTGNKLYMLSTAADVPLAAAGTKKKRRSKRVAP